jgi:hypothetical protein
MLDYNSPLILTPTKRNKGLDQTPTRFYQRFGQDGAVVNPNWLRITTEESENLFEPRREGLWVLMINPPIREWSYPNIMPIGQGYVAAVAAMDGHHIDVLDLNAERKQPVKRTDTTFSAWVEKQVIDKLAQQKPDVIGIGGIITQYKRIREIVQLCKRVYPDVPIILGGGLPPRCLTL